MSTQLTPPNGPEKWLRWLPIIAGAVALFWFWGTVVGFVLLTLENTLKSVIYGAILVFILGFIWSNPMFLWMTYTNIWRKITAIFIAMDPLSYMDSYADILVQKLKNLQKAIVNMRGRLNHLNGIIDQEAKNKAENLRMASAARQQQNEKMAAYYAVEAKGADESIQLYTPDKARMERSLKFMSELDENWDIAIRGIRSFNKRKRIQFEELKENAKTLKQSEAFLKGETEESRNYYMSIEAAEKQMAQNMAYIDDFEIRAKPILEGAAIKKTADQQDALTMLDEYMNNSKLFIPNLAVQDIEYQEVKPSVPTITNNKFNLLK
jgi:hypothetical protein